RNGARRRGRGPRLSAARPPPRVAGTPGPPRARHLPCPAGPDHRQRHRRHFDARTTPAGKQRPRCNPSRDWTPDLAVGAGPRPGPAPDPRDDRPVAERGVGMRESAVLFGAADSLVGIVTEPEPGTARTDAQAVLILNSGLVHRVGPKRMHV